MSPEERRHRNKLASAKYRAKKQASMKSMTSKLTNLVSTNASLEHELAKVKQENAMLRAMYDKTLMTNNNNPNYQQQFI
ncbi:hypothetical protein K501DRAFT_201350 [Backusella circina FSU 941]|nr:hypothetical protein K501DRAFT_201350 [Backusella circina FSU 941]